jgi:hypothetical protein
MHLGGGGMLDIKTIPNIFFSDAYLVINAQEACRNKSWVSCKGVHHCQLTRIKSGYTNKY